MPVRFYPGQKVEGRTRKIPNRYTVTGHPMDNTYVGLGIRTTTRDAGWTARDALHARGPWRKGGGGSGLTKDNVCHRVSSNAGVRVQQYNLARLVQRQNRARILSLQMDRLGEQMDQYACMIDYLDEELIEIAAAGRMDMIGHLMTLERARGAKHIRNRYEALFREVLAPQPMHTNLI